MELIILKNCTINGKLYFTNQIIDTEKLHIADWHIEHIIKNGCGKKIENENKQEKIQQEIVPVIKKRRGRRPKNKEVV